VSAFAAHERAARARLVTLQILHVLPIVSTRAGGTVAFAGPAARELIARGHNARIIATNLALAPGARPQRTIRHDEIHSVVNGLEHSLYPTRRPRRLLYSPAMRRALDVDVAEADVVHLHSLWLHPQYAGWKAAAAAGRPYVVSPHGALDPALRGRGRVRKAATMLAWQRHMLEGARLIHVTTDVEAELISDVAPHVPRVIVPVGLDRDEFTQPADPARFRTEHLNGYDGAIVLFLGRITYKKGIDILIEAFRMLRSQHPCHLVIAGPDDENLTATLRALAARLDVEDSVSFIGPVFGAHRRSALAAASVWALASHTENFGVAVIEAMAAGCPVVISPAVNIAPEIQSARAGVVSAAVTPAAMAASLREVLGDRAAAERFVQAGRRFAERYDWRVIADDLEGMYLQAVQPASTHSRTAVLR
jgi:glycosyltransferase involved in cell wall biosynthesis